MSLTGTQKAAIFLLSLDEANAISIVDQFSEEELRLLRKAVEELEPVNTDTLDGIYGEFASAFKSGLTTMQDGGRYLKDLVRKARGEDQARRLFAADERLMLEPGAAPRPLAALADVSPDALKVVLGDEHPQVAAAVLANLEPEMAAGAIDGLEAERKVDIMRRITTLGAIPGAALADAEVALGGLDLSGSADGEVDGIGSAADILKAMPNQEANDLLDQLSMDNPTEAVKLRQAMFTFEDLSEADARGLQALLREVQSDTLLVALKNASEDLREKIFACMSSRAADMLRDEIEMMPPMRKSDVENAQQQIVDFAMQLISEGRLFISGSGEDMV